MSFGYKLFDGAGQVILDVSDRLIRFHSLHQVTQLDPNGPGTGFVYVLGMARDSNWFVAAGSTGDPYTFLHCTVQNGGFRWNVVASGPIVNCTVSVFRL